jgi:hypothetical protein
MKTITLRRNQVLIVLILFIGAFIISNQGGNITNAMDLEVGWTEHFIDDSANHPRAVFAGDIDGDGDNDVVSVNSDWSMFNEVAWYENPGDCFNSWTKHVIHALSPGCSLLDVFAIDIDGDNDIDVVTGGFSTGSCDSDLVWYENNRDSLPAWIPHLIPQSEGAVQYSKGWGISIFAKDINGDGHVDILWGGAGVDQLRWYENSGGSSPSWTENIIPSTIFLDGGTSVFAADLNNDDSVDVVVGGMGYGELAWYQNPSWIERTIYDYPTENIFDIFAIDVDKDSHIDILCAASDTLHWFKNNGGSPPSWTKHLIYPLSYLYSIHGIDIDNDNDVDVVGASLSGRVYWFENGGGSPPPWTKHNVGIVDNRQFEVESVFPIDLDKDSDNDIVAGSSDSGRIVWFENLLCNFRITNISDVGNDQGKQVRVKWNRCCYDEVGSPITITEYSLWRRIDEYKNTGKTDDEWLLQAGEFQKGRIYPPGDWDFVKTVPARGEEEYNTVCPTLADSTQADWYWSVFFVSAMTSDPLVYFDCCPDSGYSLDNIQPLPIQDLEVNPSSWFTMRWTVPGEYEGEHPISNYDIRYNTVPVGADTQAWWDSAVTCPGDSFFYYFVVGDQDSFCVTTNHTSWGYPNVYFAIKGLDDRPNASEISNFYHFICGDVTANGLVDLGDVVYLITFQYKNGPPPKPMASGDCTCNGVVDLGDVVYLINYQYKSGFAPCSH